MAPDFIEWLKDELGPMEPDGTNWPVASLILTFKQLGSHLANTAASHARHALDDFASDDQFRQLGAAINVGCAVELMAKSFLYSIDPTLLAGRADTPDTLLYLTNKGRRARIAATDIKTRGARDCMMRIKYLEPSFQFNPESDDGLVFRVRNSSAHMAIVDRDELRTAVSVMVRVLEDLRQREGSTDKEHFWGADRTNLVEDMLNVAVAERRRVVAAKLTRARAHLAELLNDFPEATKSALLSSLSNRAGRWSTAHEERQDCPVCQQQGWLRYEEERGDLKYDLRGTRGPVFRVDRIGYPIMFECPVCELIIQEGELCEFDFPGDIIELEPDYDPYEAELIEEDAE